jgi:sortase A
MPLGRRTDHRYRRHRFNSSVVLALAGALSICAGIAIAAQIGAFYLHSSIAGGALVRQESKAIAAAAGNTTACRATGGGQGGQGAAAQGDTAQGDTAQGAAEPDGLLEAPVLGLVAPVLQGTGDSVLSDAVGHNPASAWPGQSGTSVLSAHDVTWFSHIGQLRAGNEIRYVTPCRTYTFTVTSHVIVSDDSPVYSTGAARLVLDTCYPLDALYITSSRYLVYASLVSSSPTHPTADVPVSWPTPAVPAPAPLAAQGLGLTTNDTPLGTFRLEGSASTAWAQSSAPLRFEAAALAAYFGIERSAGQEKADWWRDLAPSVPIAAAGPLWGGQITTYISALEVTLRATGTRPVAAALAATVTITGPDGPADYDLTVGETVSGGKLYVTRVRVIPAG